MWDGGGGGKNSGHVAMFGHMLPDLASMHRVVIKDH